jgi:hypothetical protein
MTIIQYRPRVTIEPALRAAWTPDVVGGVIPDLSGNGKNGTPVKPEMLIEDDPYFGKVMRTFAKEGGFSFPATLGLTTVGTWGFWFKTATLVLPVGTLAALLSANVSNGYFGLSAPGLAYTFGTVVISGTPRNITHAVSTRVDVWTLYTCTYDGDKLRIYRDGELGNTSPSYPGTIDSWDAGTGYVGRLSALTYSFDGRIRSPFVLNRCLSGIEVADLYNKAKAACWKTDYGAVVSLADEGGVIGNYLSNTPWRFGDATGRWRVETDTIEGRQCKVITCKTAGLLYLDARQMKQEPGAAAFGEWDFWFKHASGTAWYMLFCASVPLGATDAGQNGYRVYGDTTPTAVIHKRTAGVGSTVAGPAAWPVGSAYFNWKIQRTVAGVFTMSRSDGLSMTGTDTSHLASNYVVLSMGADDKMALGDIGGRHSFRKGLKG